MELRGPQAQVEIDSCAALNFERADRRAQCGLAGRCCRRARADGEIDRRYDSRATGEAKLREAQRAWIVFRDAHCTYDSYESRGGSMEPLLYHGCRAALTRERIRQLTGPADDAEQ